MAQSKTVTVTITGKSSFPPPGRQFSKEILCTQPMCHSLLRFIFSLRQLPPRAGEHEHTISGYSLLKGIGDGEPIASDRFTVGGHEWVLLFYPDGKRSVNEMQGQPQPNDDPYAALFVALIGEGPRPLGVVQSSSGRVVRAFHRFTLVDQNKSGRDITKGRQRDQGAVKISCARQDPNARNCHGYRKFVRRSVLEAPNSGYLVDDTIVIRYEVRESSTPISLCSARE